jgi:WD domain, G-beta repeat
MSMFDFTLKNTISLNNTYNEIIFDHDGSRMYVIGSDLLKAYDRMGDNYTYIGEIDSEYLVDWYLNSKGTYLYSRLNVPDIVDRKGFGSKISRYNTKSFKMDYTIYDSEIGLQGYTFIAGGKNVILSYRNNDYLSYCKRLEIPYDESKEVNVEAKEIYPYGMLEIDQIPAEYGMIYLLSDPEGEYIFGQNGNGIVVINRTQKRIAAKLLGPKYVGVRKMALCNKYPIIAYCGPKNECILWDYKRGIYARQLKDHYLPIRSVSFTQDGGFLLTSSEDKTVKIWDWERGYCLDTLEHPETVYYATATPDGSQIVSLCGDGIMRFWVSNQFQMHIKKNKIAADKNKPIPDKNKPMADKNRPILDKNKKSEDKLSSLMAEINMLEKMDNNNQNKDNNQERVEETENNEDTGWDD